MIRKIAAVLCFISALPILYAQTVTLVKEFPFGKPFVFSSWWDENEGPIPGPGQLHFLNQDIVLTTDGRSESFIFFNKNWEIVNQYNRGWGIRKVHVGMKNVLFGTSSNSQIKDPIWVVPRNGPYNNPVKLTSPSGAGSSSMLSTGKWVFSIEGENKIISWELRSGNLAPLYRDNAETERLLEQGLATELDYQKNARPFGLPRFGSRFLTNMSLSEPVVNSSFVGHFFDLQQAKGLGLNTGNLSMAFSDTDARGLYYFYAITPELSGTTGSSKDTYLNPEKRLVFAIADPWTKRVIFRALPPGFWTPPVSEEKGLLGTYPISIDPAGRIYFFDADVDRKVYELKRVENSWWIELGVDKRTVGIVTENRVRIREKPNTAGAVTGYVYENEYAWVLDQSKETETIGGSTAPWMKVRMSDGREGWMFGAFIDIQK